MTMLEFFRRYQRGFFIVITVVIVISFSFFGTFQTFNQREHEDKVAFTALDGTKVYRSEVADMVAFLSTDSRDFLYSGSMSGNALNDGTLATDILGSGLAQQIAMPYLNEFGQELKTRHDRERRYKPYVHPRAPFLSSEQIWTYYAPDVKANYDRLVNSENPKGKEAFDARVRLYVAERNFPSPYLRQFLRYQEASHKWLPQDPNLMHQDLALFGYHGAQDWFGRQFVELAAQFIINSAKVAEQKGFTITQEEAVGSLYKNADQAYREAKAQGMQTQATMGDFFHEQLRRLGMDQSRAAKIWKDVLLFRTLFFENADSTLVDPASYKDYFHHLNEYVDVDLYQLPKDLRFASLEDLEQFQLYLNAVRPAVEGTKQNPLSIPLAFANAHAVKKVYPELVEKSYTVRIREANKEALQTKIGVRGTWEWQIADKNWSDLKAKFPELAKKDANSQEERLKLLDSLDPAKRSQIDNHSRKQIVDEHPEWLADALANASVREETIVVREQGGSSPFTGFKNTAELITLLDKAPLNEQSAELSKLSQDGVHYIQLELLERSSPERVLSFAEAKEDGTMEKILDKVLESSYPRVRSKQPSLFLKENGDWKPFKDVKSSVALYHFEELFRFLEQEIALYKGKLPQYTDWSSKDNAYLAVALLPYMQEEKQEVLKALAKSEEWKEIPESERASGPRQFAIVKTRDRVVRAGPSYSVNPELAFATEMENMSSLTSYQSSGPMFFAVVGKGFMPSVEEVRSKVFDEREMIGREAIEKVAADILAGMQKKGAYDIQLVSES